MDRNGDVDTIEIGLGHDLPQPPTTNTNTNTNTNNGSNGGNYSPEDIAYLQQLRGQFDPLAKSMDDFKTVLDGMSNGTISGGDAGTQLRVIFDTWRQAAQDAQTLNPPASSKDTNDLYLELTGLLSQAADEYTNGILNNDQSQLQSGDKKYGQAAIERVLIEATLSAAGV
jgi:hypothetical protein